MKKTKRIVLVAAMTCGLCALAACANNPNDNAAGTNPTTTNSVTGNNATENGGVARDIANDIKGGAENLATDLGINGTNNNATTTNTTQPTTTSKR